MRVFQCDGCTRGPCLNITLDPEADSDNMSCMHPKTGNVPVFRELGVVEG